MKTKIVRIDYQKPLAAQLTEAAEILRAGGLAAFPTETVYGLGGSALDGDAAHRIYAAKGRPSDNPLIVHVAKPSDAEKYAVTNALYEKLARAFMPGPLTVVLPKRENVPCSVTGGLTTVGIRCPGHPVARELIRLAGVPIAAPSANLSGKPSPTAARHCIDDLFGRVDCIIDGGDSEVGLESTIVKITGDTLTLLRPGAITPEMLKTVCPSVTIDEGVLDRLPDGVAPQAPGMKYRHYAPRAKVYLIRSAQDDGFDERAIAFLRERLTESPDVGILCFDEYAPHLSGKNVLTFGKKDDEAAHSHLLFDRLRRFDETDAEAIYATAGSTSGIGLALYNRMLKASGYTVLII
ncbi:MAG: threonylcarbamoyl-AMP synthase [Clostridia bacterium]|nr:threonylcarbamoyl-AMP synthase [Clostridia bacterium]